MSLDIHIRADKRGPRSRSTLSFEDDGYYWFFYPLFARLRDETGKFLDLYGDTTFSRDDFPRLRRLLDEAALMAGRQGRTWEVHVGTALQPTRRELYQTVRQEQVLAIIATLREMVKEAESVGGFLECVGD